MAGLRHAATAHTPWEGSVVTPGRAVKAATAARLPVACGSGGLRPSAVLTVGRQRPWPIIQPTKRMAVSSSPTTGSALCGLIL